MTNWLQFSQLPSRLSFYTLTLNKWTINSLKMLIEVDYIALECNYNTHEAPPPIKPSSDLCAVTLSIIACRALSTSSLMKALLSPDLVRSVLERISTSCKTNHFHSHNQHILTFQNYVRII